MCVCVCESHVIPFIKSFNVFSSQRCKGPSSSGSCYISSFISLHSPIIILPLIRDKILAVNKIWHTFSCLLLKMPLNPTFLC